MAPKSPSTLEALWQRLKDGQLGVDFSFRERAKGYRVDLYCPAARLVVELDEPATATKASAKQKADRDAGLVEKGLVVLRLSADMTTDDMVERIDRKLHFLQVERRPVLTESADSQAVDAA